MIIQQYPDELNYCNAMLHPLGPRHGSFLELFLQACLRADAENYELLRSLLHVLMNKYPADAERLEVERQDAR